MVFNIIWSSDLHIGKTNNTKESIKNIERIVKAQKILKD